ncbi:peptide ABC transporter substrate-binding protein, partial [Myxococcota bacterium]|nr:peptide ABC transporter substrate-binding protein [Myxococcota bacterium]
RSPCGARLRASRMITRIARPASLALTVALALAACRRSEPGSTRAPEGSGGGTSCVPGAGARIALATLPNTLDWNKSHEASYVNYPVMLAMMCGLTSLDANNQPIPGLAERWDVELTTDTPPRQIYTFHLKKGLVWSDGKTPFVAEDFVFAWRRAAAEGNEGAELLDVVGAREIFAARDAKGSAEELRAKVAELVKGLGVEALDHHTLRVTLASPRSYFLARLAYVYPFFPAPSALLAGMTEEQIQRWFDEPKDGRPYVLGAFTVEKWDRVAQTIRLAANPHHPDRPASGVVEKLTLVQADLSPILYEQCKIDFLLMDDPSTLATAPADLEHTPLLSIYYLGFNTTKVPKTLRRAIAHALDRPKLTLGLLPSARTAHTYLPPEMPGAIDASDPAAKELPGFDPAKARALLTEANYQGEELTLLVRGSSTFMPELGIADAVRRQLELAGVNVKVVPSADFTNDLKAPDGTLRHHLFLKRVGADYAHPQTLFTPFQAKGNHYTDWQKLEGGAVIARFQRLLDEGAAATDPEVMKQIYGQVQALMLAEETIVVPIYFPDRYYRKRPWISGLSIDPFNFLTLRSMRLEPFGAVPGTTTATGTPRAADPGLAPPDLAPRPTATSTAR